VYIPLRSTDSGRDAQRVRVGRQRRDRHDGLLLACDQRGGLGVGVGVSVDLGDSCHGQGLMTQSFAVVSTARPGLLVLGSEPWIEKLDEVTPSAQWVVLAVLDA
jgi:hypothetical protein